LTNGLATTWTIAAKALRRNKLQSTLTMIGMSVGVATVLAMMALGTGAQRAIEDQVRAAGMNMLIVTAGNFQAKRDAPPPDAIEMGRIEVPGTHFAPAAWSGGGSLRMAYFHPEDDPFAVHDHPTARQRLGDAEAGLGSAATLTIADADAIRAIKGVQYVSEGIHENIHILRDPDKRWFTRVHGDDTSLPEIRRSWTFLHGRFFSAREQAKNAQVAVLGAVVAKQLFGDQNPVGETVTLWKQTFKIVGVVGSSSWLSTPEAGDDQFDAVYLPVTTMQHLLNLSKLNDITVTTISTGDVTRVSKLITTLLRERHGIVADRPDDFTVATQASKAITKGSMRPEVAHAVTGNINGLEKITLDQLGKSLDRSSKTMTALLVGIATVSLIVGGIGIMNIMLLSVTERTREIGIRRAVGAQEREVLAQFLMESITLSVSGGVIGVIVGVIASIAIAHAAHWSTAIPLNAVLLSFGISTVVGIFFGYYPAREASQVAPLASLRYE
jgi:putative ABC transport system permease protein